MLKGSKFILDKLKYVYIKLYCNQYNNTCICINFRDSSLYRYKNYRIWLSFAICVQITKSQ